MLQAHWLLLACFMAGVLTVALYGLAASGHFPREARGARLQGSGGLVLWGTLAVAALAAAGLLVEAWGRLPWHMAVIGGGAMLLFAPLVLRPFPDSFVDGCSALLVFSAAAAGLAVVMWRWT
jgi:hypothetical protein